MQQTGFIHSPNIKQWLVGLNLYAFNQKSGRMRTDIIKSHYHIICENYSLINIIFR